MACIFSTSQLQKVVRTSGIFKTHLGLERHKGAPTALACLRFGSPEPPFIGKTQCVATFYLFAHMDILSSGFLFFDILSSSLLFSSLLCLFPPMLFICPVCRKFDFYIFFVYLSYLILSYHICLILSI